MTEQEEIEQRIADYGERKLYWRCVFGLSLTGLFITLPLILVDPALCWVGALKGPAYAIGWGVKLPEIKINKFTIKEETEWGEFLTGLFVWSTLLWMLI